MNHFFKYDSSNSANSNSLSEDSFSESSKSLSISISSLSSMINDCTISSVSVLTICLDFFELFDRC